MKHLGLFEGIGGFSLAARWMGWETVAWVEINEFCQKVLKKNFPEAKGYGDIKEFDGTPYRGTIDIITGGFPCQPYSVAGKRKGKEDSRHLWPEMLRVIREVQPKWIVGENVGGLLSWNGGLVFEEVHTDLEDEGYEVQAFLLPAAGVGAPHKRDRVWFIAFNAKHITNGGYNTGESGTAGMEVAWNVMGEARRIESTDNIKSSSINASNSTGARWVQSQYRNESGFNHKDGQANTWEKFPTQSPVRLGNDGIPSRLVRSAIEAGGNAIVPQVAFEIFKAIEAVNKQ